jgi:hypothetical protein
MDSDMLASSDEKGTPFTYAYNSRYCPDFAKSVSNINQEVFLKGTQA